MKFIPKRPTLEEIVAKYGGLQAYLNHPVQIKLNNGHGYDDIMLLFEVGVSAVVRQTKRNKKTVYNWKAIKDKE